MSRKQDINAMDSALQGGDAGFVNSDAQRRSNADWTKQQSLRGSSPRNRKNRLNVAAGSAIQSGLGAATGAGLAAVASGSKRAMTIGALGGAATGLATGYQAGKRVNAKQTQLGSVLRSKQRGDIKLSRNGVNPLTGINKSAFGVVHTDISKGLMGSSYELHPDHKMNRKMNKARRKTNKTKPSSAHDAYSHWASQLPSRNRSPYTESVGDAAGTEEAFSYFKHKYSDGKDDFGRPMVKPQKTNSVLRRSKKRNI